MKWTVGSTGILMLLLVSHLSAQHLEWLFDLNGENSGHTVCRFLTLPSSAAALSRGEASAAGTGTALDLPGYTAYTAAADRYRFSFSHLEWLMGMRKEYLGALFPVLDVGTFGFYSQLFTPGPFENARDIDEHPSDLSYLEYSLGATYARTFLNKSLSAGCALAFVESRIEQLTGRTMTLNADVRYVPFSYIAGHFRVTSVGKALRYDYGPPASLPTEIAGSLQLSPFPAKHPLNKVLKMKIGFGGRKIIDEAAVAGISTRIDIGSYYTFRAGYEYTKGATASLNGLSVGSALKWGAVDLEGAWRYYSSEFGPVWSLSLSYEREELKKRTAEDYYRIALKHYAKKRYYFCTLNARRALRLDPNMWKAHALISRMKSDIRRKEHREIALIYTGNAQGTFVPPVDEGAVGGFARQATVIASLRQQFPVSFAVECGNMIPSDMQSPRKSFVAFYLNYINYDIVGCGSGEFLYGTPKLVEATDKKQQFICSNTLSTPSGVIRHKIIEQGGYRFFVASCINPLIIPEIKRGLLLPFDERSLKNKQKNCDLRILIVHSTWEAVKALARSLTSFDIIICGNLDQRFATPMKVGRIMILSAGSNGRYVGNLTLEFDKQRKLIKANNKLIPLHSSISPDSTVARKIALFSHKAVMQKPQPGVNQAIDGTLVFISDRAGKKNIFLKVSKQMAEFPLTRSIADTCDRPVVSFPAGLIACRAATESCRRLLVMHFDGSEKRYIADSLEVRDASFTPDGTWLYYAAAPCGDTVTSLYRVKSEGGPSFPVLSWPDATITAPSFSTDGASMIFRSDQDGSMQLYLTNPEAEQPLRITDEKAQYSAPAFSPDGKYIAYLSDFTNFGGRKDLWLFVRDGGTHRRITQRSDVKEFCWLSDSRTIIYTMGVINDELAAVDITTYRFRKLIAHHGRKNWKERAPQTMPYKGEEHIIYVRDYPEEKDRRIYRIRPDGTNDTRIVNSSGSDWLPMNEE